MAVTVTGYVATGAPPNPTADALPPAIGTLVQAVPPLYVNTMVPPPAETVPVQVVWELPTVVGFGEQDTPAVLVPLAPPVMFAPESPIAKVECSCVTD